MTADLSREEIAFAREFGPQSPVMKRVIDAAEAHRDQSTSITALEAENAALREKVAAADRALEPFAGIGAWLFARDLPDVMPLVDILGINGASGVLTRGDFKAAHTARALLQGQGGGDDR